MLVKYKQGFLSVLATTTDQSIMFYVFAKHLTSCSFQTSCGEMTCCVYQSCLVGSSSASPVGPCIFVTLIKLLEDVAAVASSFSFCRSVCSSLDQFDPSLFPFAAACPCKGSVSSTRR